MKELIKFFVVYLVRLLSKVFWIFPVKKNRVLFISQNGNQYSCNPKYISEYLVKEGLYDIIWAFNEPKKYEELRKKNITLVKYRSLQFYFYKATSKITICNVNASGEMSARKSQYDIQTWHGGGGGYKKSSTDDKTISLLEKKRLELDNKRYSLCCASSRTNMNNTILGAMHHKGTVLGGTPRNDILVNGNRPELYQKVRKFYCLSADEKIFLFAPTWRKGRKATDYKLDYEEIKNVLSEKFGGKWTVLVRFHHMVKNDHKELGTNIINATNYPDMQELLYAADVLMTDYSSSIWDFSFTGKPCFLYCSDLREFKEERDFYSPIHSWGFPICESSEELYKAIREYDEATFKNNMRIHHEKNDSFEDGKATEHIAKIIYAQSFENGKMPSGIPYKQ